MTMPKPTDPVLLDVDGINIAYRARRGAQPTLVWLGGYRSDMRGTKAEHLDTVAAREGIGFLRLDYSGHGESGGRFADGTISRWLSQALAVIEAATRGPLILIGSSMGGWIALRAVQEFVARNETGRVAGMVLIAPAPDFTSALIEPKLTEANRADLAQKGYFEVPSDYAPEPDIFTAALIEDGQRNRVLDGIIHTHCPVIILQGMRDADVPFSHALRLVDHLPADDVTITLVKDGDHRLSRPEDLALIERAVLELAARVTS